MVIDFPTAEVLRNLRETAQYMVLSTVNEDGSPHTSPVFFAEGRWLCFYWLSTLEAQHSQNIARDPRVAAVIMDTTHKQGEGAALYFNGHATTKLDFPLGGDEYEQAAHWLCKKSKTLKGRETDLLSADCPRKIFRLWVDKASCNGAVFNEASGLWLDRKMDIPIEIADFRRYMRLAA